MTPAAARRRVIIIGTVDVLLRSSALVRWLLEKNPVRHYEILVGTIVQVILSVGLLGFQEWARKIWLLLTWAAFAAALSMEIFWSRAVSSSAEDFITGFLSMFLYTVIMGAFWIWATWQLTRPDVKAIFKKHNS